MDLSSSSSLDVSADLPTTEMNKSIGPKRKPFRPNLGLAVTLTAALTWRFAFFVHEYNAKMMNPPETYLHGVQKQDWKLGPHFPVEEPEENSTNVPTKDKETAATTEGKTIAEAQISKHSSPKTSIEQYTGPSRAWNQFEGGFPCYRGEKQLMVTTPSPDRRGFFFHRPMKVGSTTMVGVVLRLAHNRSPWLKRQDIKCRHRSMHGSALSMQYDKRDPSQSFLFSLIRHPTKRVISEFYHFIVASVQVEPTDENFLKHLSSPGIKHKYLYDLSARNYTQHFDLGNLTSDFDNQYRRQLANIMKRKDRKGANQIATLRKEHMTFGSNNPNYTQIVQDILEDYNFIAITERMDESLVAMQMLLNLTTKDILYTRARSSGGWSNGGTPKRPCIFIPPSYVSPDMQTYFQSSEWKEKMKGDIMLYEAANASLDKTIETLGRDEFQRNLRALKDGLKRAEDNCQGRVTTLCTAGGKPVPFVNNTCYIWGEACDHECINELEM